MLSGTKPEARERVRVMFRSFGRFYEFVFQIDWLPK
jgi:hypothetical protein